jgi:hypothetical protein
MNSLPGKRAVMVFLVVAAVMLIPLAANATIADLIPPLSGSRTTPDTSGVVAADGWAAASGGFKVSWVITQQGTNSYFTGTNYLYQYTFSNADGTTPTTPNISHLLLETSGNFTLADIKAATIDGIAATLTGPTTFDGQVGSASGPGDNNGNPNLPGDLFGIKLESTADSKTVFAFYSDRAPMWGDFYVKDGAPGTDHIIATAWNTGFGTNPDINTPSADFYKWIAVPDTKPGGVPVPPTVWLMGSGLVGLGLMGWRRRKH